MRKERFNELLEAQLPTLQFHAQLFMHDSDQAQDLVQDAVLLMLEKRGTYQDSNFGGWSYTLLYNLKRNLSRKRREAEYNDDINCYDSAYLERTDEELDIDYSLNKVSSALRHTTELYLKGYLYEEIAQLQKIELGTVKSRINRARKQLQKILKDYR